MRVAIAGGTGTVGHYAAAAAEAAGHQVSLLSRRTGVDVFTGAGVAEALRGVDVLVDTLNPSSTRRAAAERFFTTTSRRLQAAADDANVKHIVALSILGLELVPDYGYFQAKLAQEGVLRAGHVPTTILRTSQFYEFAAQMVRLTRRGRVALVPRLRSQPIAARTVGCSLMKLAEEQPGGLREMAGPDVYEIPDLARRIVTARGERLHVYGFSLPGRAGTQLRSDAMLATADTVIGGPSFDGWLTSGDAQEVALTR